MSDMTTIARPYAKAVFEYALKTKHLAEWSGILLALAEVVTDEAAQAFITDPSTTVKQQSELLLSVLMQGNYKNQQQAISNLIALLAENKRLAILPSLYVQYQALRAEQEKTLAVEVKSFAPLTEEQQQQLIKSLSQRLQRQITLEVSIEPSLLGGAVIQAGDLVIDGSVRGKLHKLQTNLAA